MWGHAPTGNFACAKRSNSVMRNNKNIWIGRKLVFYKTFFDKNVILILQFGLSKSNLEPLKIIKNETNIMCYFLQWAGLRAAIPQMLN